MESRLTKVCTSPLGVTPAVAVGALRLSAAELMRLVRDVCFGPCCSSPTSRTKGNIPDLSEHRGPRTTSRT